MTKTWHTVLSNLKTLTESTVYLNSSYPKHTINYYINICVWIQWEIFRLSMHFFFENLLEIEKKYLWQVSSYSCWNFLVFRFFFSKYTSTHINHWSSNDICQPKGVINKRHSNNINASICIYISICIHCKSFSTINLQFDFGG